MWPWKRTQEPRESTKSRMKAEQDLKITRAETPRYQALADSLREVRERNNFAAAIEATFRS